LTFLILKVTIYKINFVNNKNCQHKIHKIIFNFSLHLGHPTKTTQEYSYILSLHNITQVSESVDKSNHVLQESHNTHSVYINVLQGTMSLDGKMFFFF
jgi:hypothetical protein